MVHDSEGTDVRFQEPVEKAAADCILPGGPREGL